MITLRMGCVAEVWIRMIHFEKAGEEEITHEHDFDHVTLLAHGALDLTVDGVMTHYTAPHMIFIAKNKKHALVATVDDTLACCIHGMRDPQGEFIDLDMIPGGVLEQMKHRVHF